MRGCSLDIKMLYRFVLRVLWDIRLSSFISPVTRSGGAAQLRRSSSSLFAVQFHGKGRSVHIEGKGKKTNKDKKFQVSFPLKLDPIMLAKF